MRAHVRLLASLPSPARLIWLVVLALALQPLAWARQPDAQWVSLPYCATSAAPGQHGTPDIAGATTGHAHHLRVLLNPAAALNAAGTQLALPAVSNPGVASPAPAARQRLPQPAEPHCTATRQRPQQPRAPPQLS